MTKIKIRQLIDIALGTPGTGHFNFCALHCVLSSLAEKLEINDEDVDFSNKENEGFCLHTKFLEYDLSKTRLFGGSNSAETGLEKEQEQQPEKTEMLETVDVLGMAEEKKNEETHPQSEEAVLEETMIKSAKSQEYEKSVEHEKTNEPEQVLAPGFLNRLSSKSTISKKSGSQLSFHEIKQGLSNIKTTGSHNVIPQEIFSRLSNQIELITEQLLLLTFLTVSKKPDSNKIQQLYSMSQALQTAKKENIFLKGDDHLQLPNIPSINWQTANLQLNEILSENDVLEAQSSSHHTIEVTRGNDLEFHLCYSADKLLNQLMELKSEFCLLTNKVNELSARLLEQESQRTIAFIYEIQQQIQDLKIITMNLKEQHGSLDMRVSSNTSSIDAISQTMEEILIEKVKKTDLEIQLADKVDYKQLQQKVSVDQMFELQCRIDKRFCEVLRQINENDKKCTLEIKNVRETLGFSAIEGILKTFKENITKDIQSLQMLLKTYIDSTNDDCAAAAGRIKVLQDFSCLSCDTTCVMRTIEKSKVGKLPSAHVTNILSPLITYELGSIRKSGIMGYYRKDEFSHSTNAWLTDKSNALKSIKHCVPHHAGGKQIVNSVKGLAKKELLNRT